MTDFTHIDKYLPCKYIVVTEKYLFDDVKYISSMYGKSIITAALQNNSLSKSCFDAAERFIDYPNIVENTRITYENGFFYYGGRLIDLTKTELLILKLFLINDTYISSDIIADYCINSDKSAIASHILRINNKISRLSGEKFIECKRYNGYKIKKGL